MGDLGVRQRTNHATRNSPHQHPRRNPEARRRDRAGGHHRFFAHEDTVEDHRPHPHQTTPPEAAAVQDRLMADGDFLVHGGRFGALVAVDHRPVLNVRAGAYADGVHIAAQHGGKPDRGVLAEGHIADQGGARGDEGGGRRLRRVAAQTDEHGNGTEFGARRTA